MSALGNVLDAGGVADVLGWTLLYFLWQGALVALLLWCALALLRGVSARTRYAACCLALLSIVTLPVATFARLGGFERGGTGFRVVAPWVVNIDAVGGGAAHEPLSQRAMELLQVSAPVLPWIWLMGVVVCAGRLGLGLLAARRLRRTGVSVAGEQVADTFASVAERVGVKRVVALLESVRVEAPTVVGWLRPVVLLPACCFAGLSTEQVEALLAHELAHIRRHDYLVTVLQSVVEALLFYHPAVWWVSRQIRRERECCCDEVAAECCGDRLNYARALSWLEEQRLVAPAVGLGANGGVLHMRIRRVLGYREGSVASQMGAVAVLCVLAGSVTAMMVREARAEKQVATVLAKSVVPESGSAPAGAIQRSVGHKEARAMVNAAEVKLPTLYAKWLNEDVVWIIQPEERDEFLATRSDTERDRFIKLFWLHRDEQPGVASYSFRAQHYARVAYSNEHFGGSGVPGWKSDRGHVYIVNGKPESIESHPSGGVDAKGKQVNYPFEVWRYGKPTIAEQDKLEFVDSCRCGQYKLTWDGPSDGAATSATLLQTPSVSSIAESLAGANIRKIDYEGLSSITIADLRDRLTNQGVHLALETPYDPDQSALAASIIRQMLAERNRSDATVKVIARPMAPNSVSILFSVQEGPGLVRTSYAGPESGRGAAGAQAGSGELSGVIIDPTGAVMPRVAVSVANVETGERKSTQTDEEGRYSISIPAGRYTVGAAATGFKMAVAQNVQVAPADPMHLTLKLQVGATSEYMKVNGSAAPGATPAAAQGSNGPIRVSAGLVAENSVSQAQPVYPAEAKAKHIQGTVVLHAMISKTGDVTDLVAVSGPDELQSAAMDAVKQWKYRPYLLNGNPVDVDTTIRVNFSLGGPVANAPEAAPGASRQPGRPVRVSAGVMAGQAIAQASPVYPSDAKTARVQGTVMLHAVVSKAGDIEDLQVVSGPQELTQSAIDAVKEWKYKPYLLNGEPVAVETTINVNYTLAE